MRLKERLESYVVNTSSTAHKRSLNDCVFMRVSKLSRTVSRLKRGYRVTGAAKW
jgi:hypothetical protein